MTAASLPRPDIQPLPREVADAIAAGEVIERPASVVKELVENSLDAGATRISLELRGAGRTQIRVVDDGAGIRAEQLRLAFLRHATSKLRSVSDIETVTSLGFRGEALAAIAAVAEVEVQSQARRLRLRASEVIEEGDAPPVPGTVMDVRDLFHATPARLKFLKADPTEVGAAVSVMQHLALFNPAVRLTVTVEGRRTFESRGGGSVRSAAAAVLGERVATDLLEVEHHDGAVGVRGLVSPPHLSRGNRHGIILAVNGRPVVSRALGFALDECYRGRLEVGRFPIVVLDVGLDPSLVDVNVHPAKREVKFRDEGSVFRAVQQAVRAALAGAGGVRLSFATAPAPAWQAPVASVSQLAWESVEAGTQPTSHPAGAPAEPLRPVGQVQDGYLVAESASGLVLVDQHAAHERIIFERLRVEVAEQPIAAQALLIPVIIELDPTQSQVLADHAAHLTRLGFDVQPFGTRTVRLDAAPATLPAERIEATFTAILDDLAGSEGRDASSPADLARGERLQAALVSLACHSAVRFGDALDLSEQRRLLIDIENLGAAATCPHGRPIRLQIEWSQLTRHFRRNY